MFKTFVSERLLIGSLSGSAKRTVESEGCSCSGVPVPYKYDSVQARWWYLALTEFTESSKRRRYVA